MSGRKKVLPEDLEIVRHIAYSTITYARREVLRAVLVKGGTLSSADAGEILRVSRPTARARMKELAATGIVSWRAGSGKAGESIVLEDKWKWLLTFEADVEQERDEPEIEEDPLVEGVLCAENKVPLCAVEAPISLAGSL